jgi:predicted ribonuclease YlaK
LSRKASRNNNKRIDDNLFVNFKSFQPYKGNQTRATNILRSGKNLVMTGYPGTGKTYCALYYALEEMRNKNISHIRIIRSPTPTKDIGFLPGTEEEKMQVYEAPYSSIVNSILHRDDAYGLLKKKNQIEFDSTSFLRGLTFDNAFIIVDEFQNMTFHELNTIITRVGEDTRIIFCGDKNQSDHTNGSEDFNTFINIIRRLPDEFGTVEMEASDIVRSGLVKKWILATFNQPKPQQSYTPAYSIA